MADRLERGRVARRSPSTRTGAAATTTTRRPAHGPHAGLALARPIAQITYRSDPVFRDRFDRDARRPARRVPTRGTKFQVECYLDYHGDKLVRRFDANSYLVLNKAMDLHDVGRGRGGVCRRRVARVDAPALRRVDHAPTRCTRPTSRSELRDVLVGAGHCACDYHLIDSPHGHDGFLLEFDQIGPLVAEFLTAIEKSTQTGNNDA